MRTSEHPDGVDILAYLDDELEESRANEIQVHCEVCDECQEMLDGFREVQGRLASEEPMPIPMPVWPGVEKELRKDRPMNWGPAFGFSSAAACAAGLVLGLLMGEPASTVVLNQETAAWASADYLWTSANENSMLSTLSSDQTVERLGES